MATVPTSFLVIRRVAELYAAVVQAGYPGVASASNATRSAARAVAMEMGWNGPGDARRVKDYITTARELGFELPDMPPLDETHATQTRRRYLDYDPDYQALRRPMGGAAPSPAAPRRATFPVMRQPVDTSPPAPPILMPPVVVLDDPADAAGLVTAPPAPPASPEHPDAIKLRRAIAAATAAKARIKELEEALIAEEDARQRMEALHATVLPEAKWLARPAILRARQLIPILFTSDFQCGEVIRADQLDGMNEFNQDIFADRYQRMIDKTILLANECTGCTDFPGIFYLRGGDAISGEIHEELAQTNDLSAVPAVKLLQQMERAGIKRLRDRFGRIRVISIPGNHGRTTFKSHAKGYVERNFETVLAWWLASSFEDDPNVEFWCPPSGDALFEVAGWNVLLSHGDRMGSRGGQGFIGPAATIARGHKKLFDNWTSTGREVDLILTGHLHTSLMLELGFSNGSLAGYNEYARDLRCRPAPALQWLLFMHEAEKVSHKFDMRLSDWPRRTAEGFAAEA